MNVANAAHLYDILNVEKVATLKDALNVSGEVSLSSNLFLGSNAGIDSKVAGGVINIGSSKCSEINIGASELTQVISLGCGSGATIINIGAPGGNDTVNIAGNLTYVSSSTLQIADKNVVVNRDGTAATGAGAGIAVEEAGSNTGYLQVSGTRASWSVKAPASAGVVSIAPGSSGFTLDQGSHDPTSIGASSNGLSISNQVISLGNASASAPGALSVVDWSNFNSASSKVNGAGVSQVEVGYLVGVTSSIQSQFSNASGALESLSNAGAASLSNAVASQASALIAYSNADAAALSNAMASQTYALVSLSNAEAVALSNAVASQTSALVSLSNAEAVALSNAVASQTSALMSLSNAEAVALSNAVASQTSELMSLSNAEAAALSNAVASQTAALVSLSNAEAVALSNAVAYQTTALVAYSNADVAAQAAYVAKVSAQFSSSNISASNLNVNSIFVSGNIIPTSNIAYDLGSSNARFRDLFLSGHTIDLAGVQLTTNATGGISIGSNVYAESVLGVYGSFSSNVNSYSINATTISAGSFVGAIGTAAQPGITSVGTLNGLNLNGSLIMTNNSIIDGPANGSLNIGINASNVVIGSSAAAQRISLGKGFNNSIIDIGGNSDDTINLNGTVNILGGLAFVKATALDVADKNITINKNGAQYSGYGAGISVEENGAVAGYAQVSGDALRTGWEFKAPGSAGIVSVVPGSAGFSLTQGSHDAATVNAGAASNGLSQSNQVFGLASASASANGALLAADWSVFNAKQPALTGAATSIASANLTASIALVSDANGKVSASAVSAVELGYLSGVSSGIQAQFSAQTSNTNSLSNASATSFSNLTATVVSNKAIGESNLAALSNASAASFVSTNGTIVSLSNASAIALSNLATTVTVNKAAGDSTASALVSLSNANALSFSNVNATVVSNKTAADLTATNLVSLSNAHISLSTACSNVVLTVAAQPSITSVGTLSSLAIQNNLNMVSGAIQFNSNNVLAVNALSNLVFGTIGASNLMMLETNGRLTVTGDFNAYGTVTSASDIRLKSDICPIKDALNKVSQLNGVNFTMNDSRVRSTGLIAQDVEAVSPEAVLEMANGFKSVAYANLVGLLVEAIKELNAKVEALQK